ncbi:4507_t:CDS:1, partial [Dentiscutata heterogama]
QNNFYPFYIRSRTNGITYFVINSAITDEYSDAFFDQLITTTQKA